VEPRPSKEEEVKYIYGDRGRKTPFKVIVPIRGRRGRALKRKHIKYAPTPEDAAVIRDLALAIYDRKAA
jgi:hypothetical protein